VPNQCEIQKRRESLVIKDSHHIRSNFAKKNHLIGTTLIYSMWNGYLKDVKDFWANNGVKIIEVHTSGHAYIDELTEFVNAIKPKNIIPNHTFHPDKY
jgi:ribonuclease J